MNRTIRYIVILCTLSFITLYVSSCRPKGILSSRQMRRVLVDLHKMDAMLQVSGMQYGHDKAEDTYYALVLDEHGITQAQFDSSLVWYTNHPQLFDKIYPRVLAQLTEERKQFEIAIQGEMPPQSGRAQNTSAAHPTLSATEARMRLDSILWQTQNGYPVLYWHEYPSVHNFENQLLP